MSETLKSYKTLEELNKLNVPGVAEESGVDSSNRYIKVFPGKVDYITVDGICNGQSKQTSSSVTNINHAAINIATIGSGYVSSIFRVGETIAINGPGGFITLGLPASGKVGEGKPFMYMDGSGIWGYAGGSELPWFIACYSETPMLFGAETIAGGDFRVGSANNYMYWKQSDDKLYVKGTIDLAGDLVSYNWNPDWLTNPPMTGYKIEYSTGNAYFGGGVVAGSTIIGNGTTTATIIGAAISQTGNFLNDVINPSIDTKSGYILKLFDVKSTTQSRSGFRAGTIEWNNSGEITSGYGVAMTPFGLVGAITLGGVTTKTFSISALDGSATFGGSLVAASGTFGTITAGALTGTLTVGGRLASTIGGAIDSDGKFINDIDIPGKLKTSTGEILKVFDVKATTQALSGFRAGDLVWDSSGARTSGKGIAMTPYGIIGHNGTKPTFSIDIDGNALFSGSLTAGISISSPIITGGTMTGGTLQTAASGSRVVISGEGFYSNKIALYYGSDSTPNGEIYSSTIGMYINNPVSGGYIIIGTADGVGMLLSGSYIGTKALAPMANNTYNLGDSSHMWNRVYTNALILAVNTANITGELIPSTSGTYSLGASTYKWYCVYTENVGSNGNYFYFDNTGRIEASNHIDPEVAGTYNLGGSVRYWNDISYKTLTDRGCLGWFDDGVELQNGEVVSDIESIKAISKHPTKKTVYGADMLDYRTFPKVSYKKATDRNGIDLPRDENDEPYIMETINNKSVKVIAQDGIEMTSVFSIMIGAFKELAIRIEKLEALLKNK